MTQPKSGAAEALGKLFSGRQNSHKPIVKALEDIGIEIRVMPVMIGDEPVDCIVIPAGELMHKEYEFITGVRFNYHNQNEVTDDEASTEVGRPSDVRGPTAKSIIRPAGPTAEL